MSNLEQALKAAAKRLDAAIKRELELREQRNHRTMSHTPTPLELEVTHFAYPPNQAVLLEPQDYARAKACVNACAEFSDPRIDIGLLKLDNEQKAKLLVSCEAALAERDTEIAQLKARVAELQALLNK